MPLVSLLPPLLLWTCSMRCSEFLLKQLHVFPAACTFRPGAGKVINSIGGDQAALRTAFSLRIFYVWLLFLQDFSPGALKSPGK